MTETTKRMDEPKGSTLEFCSDVRLSRGMAVIGAAAMVAALGSGYMRWLYPRENAWVGLVFGCGGLGVLALLLGYYRKHHGWTLRFSPEAMDYLLHSGHGAGRSEIPTEHFQIRRADITRVSVGTGTST